MPLYLTSINLSPKARTNWDIYRDEFAGNLRAHCARLTRLMMRRDRLVRYNRDRGNYIKLTVRWTPEQANLLRHYSLTLRISMSRIVDFLLRTIKPTKARNMATYPRGNYHWSENRREAEWLGSEEIYIFKPYLNLPP